MVCQEDGEMADMYVPDRAFGLEHGEVYLSVREAARVLGVSQRSVYGYIAKQKLTKLCLDEHIMLSEKEVLAFKRRAPGRTRESSPFWHLPPGQNPLSLTTIIVSLRPACDALLDQKLTEFRVQSKHEITGTCARAISRSLQSPDQLTILLFWRGESQPPAEQRTQEIAALAADLAEVCDWETALIAQGEGLVHAG